MANIENEEELFLYGDVSDLQLSNEEIIPERTETSSNADHLMEVESDQDIFEDDSDEDVTVSVVKPTPTHNPSVNIKINIRSFASNDEKPQLEEFVAEDFEQPDNINNIPGGEELNAADSEDKPWRLPGADVSDYFNYGFNESTWTAYCENQKRMRMEATLKTNDNIGVPINVIGATVATNCIPVITAPRRENNCLPIFPDMSVPPPMNNLGGFRAEPSYNDNFKPTQSNQWNRSSSNMRSPKALVEEKNRSRRINSRERDLNRRRDREHNRDRQRTDRSRSRSYRRRSRSRSPRNRYDKHKRSRRGDSYQKSKRW